MILPLTLLLLGQSPSDPGRCLIEHLKLKRTQIVGPVSDELEEYRKYASLQEEHERYWSEADPLMDPGGMRTVVLVERSRDRLVLRRDTARQADDTLGFDRAREFRIRDGRVAGMREFRSLEALAGDRPSSTHAFTHLASGALSEQFVEEFKRGDLWYSQRILHSYHPDGTIAQTAIRFLDPKAVTPERNGPRSSWEPIPSGNRQTFWRPDSTNQAWTLDSFFDYLFNADGHLVRRTSGNHPGSKWLERMDYVYDDQGRLARIQLYPWEDGVSDTPRVVEATRFAYHGDTVVQTIEQLGEKGRLEAWTRFEKVFDAACRVAAYWRHSSRVEASPHAWLRTQFVPFTASARPWLPRRILPKNPATAVDALGRRHPSTSPMATFRPPGRPGR